MPQRLCDWLHRKWPDLLKIGGLDSIEYKVVDRLPFFSPFDAMVWKGRVLVKRSFLGPEAVHYISTNGVLDDSSLEHVSLLAFHEPLHIVGVRNKGWRWYVLDYIWEALKHGYHGHGEEKSAYNTQEVLTNNFRMENPFGNLQSDKRVS